MIDRKSAARACASCRRILLAETVATVRHAEAAVRPGGELDVVPDVPRSLIKIRDELLGRVVLFGRILHREMGLPDVLQAR